MMMSKLKKIIKNVKLMLLIIILIASALCTKNDENFVYVQIFINILMIIYVIVRYKRKNPVKIIQNKIDIFVVLLVLSTAIPLVVNTYVSLTTTISTILSYITILWIYILIRGICKENPKNISYIKNIFIILTLILIVLGIENLSTNKVFDLIGIKNIINGESRLVSVFGNPNALATMIMFSFFISVNEMINSQNKLGKVIYGICNTIFILGIMLTYSKFVFLVFPFMLIIYLIITKDKTQNIHIIQNVILSLIFSVIYIYIFQKFLSYYWYLSILLFSIIWVGVVALFNEIAIKTIKYLEKIKLRTIIIAITSIIIIFTIWLIYELNNKTDLVICRENSISSYSSKKINNIKPNEKYIFSFSMYANSSQEKDDMFTINIIQRDSKSIDGITNKKVEFGNFSGTKDIEIETTSNTSEIKIEFIAKYDNIPKQWTVSELKVNDEDIILEYKHLPTKLIEKIGDINIKYKTAQERFTFIKDGLKLISRNFLTGIGGEGWKFEYGEVQEYDYTSNDIHSFYIQVWLEFGMLGIISIIAIVYLVIKLNCKNEKIIYRGIKFGILAMLLHVTMDSDMYFVFMKLILFIGLGLLSASIDKKYEAKSIKKIYFTNAIAIFISILTIILLIKPEIYQRKIVIDNLEEQVKNLDVNSDEYKKLNYEIAELCQQVIKNERYNLIHNIYENKRVEAYINSKEPDVGKVVEQYYQAMLSQENKWKYNLESIVEKSNYITITMRLLESKEDPTLYTWLKKLASINIDEYSKTKQELENAIKEKNKKIYNQTEYAMLNDNYNYAVNVYSKY